MIAAPAPTRDVRKVIRDVLSQYSDTASTYELSLHTLDRMDDKQRADALLYLLPRVIRQISASASATANAKNTAPDSTGTDAAWTAVTHEIVRVNGGDMFLKQCDEKQVDALAATRESMSEALKGRAKKFRALAQMMRDGSWATVGDVPSPVGVPLMVDAAEIHRMQRDVAGTAQVLRLIETLKEMDATGDSPSLRTARDRHRKAEQTLAEQQKDLKRLEDISKRFMGGLAGLRWTAAWHRLAERVQ